MSRKILFITPQPFFLERGSPYRVRAELQAIVENGCEVDLLCYNFGKNIALKNIKIHRSLKPFWIKKVGIGLSWNKIFLDFFLLLAAIKLVFKNKYAAIHGVEEAGVIAALISFFNKTPYIFDMHSHMSEQLSQRLVKPGGIFYRIIFGIEKFCIKRAAGIITVSDLITARVRGFAEKTPAITVEDLPLDNCFISNHIHEDKIRKELSLFNTNNIVYTGNFEPYQGIDLLLDGFAEFLSNSSIEIREKMRLIIVGGGDERDLKFKFYQEKTSNLKLNDFVIFSGQKSEDEISAYLQIADILISPRIAGAHTPLKIYSYIAAAKLIVATTITAHTNVLNSENAYLCSPSAEHLANTLSLAFSSTTEEKGTLINNASKLLEERFNKKEFSRRIGLIYSAVFGQKVSEEVMLPAQKLIANSKQFIGAR